MSEPVEGGTLLSITAEIVSIEPEGFIIKVQNDETGESIEAQTVREYAEFLIRSVNASRRDNFVAKWKPSPKARREDIDLIGMQLGMMEEWMQQELRQEPEDDGALKEVMESEEPDAQR